jgi:NAD-dependent deacetylase
MGAFVGGTGARWPEPAAFEAAVAVLAGARRVVAFTGAGISAESGVPTFRDAQTGLWARYRAEDLATPEAFARQPALVWEWYAWRRALVEGAGPNAGHRALVELETRVAEFTLVTQNVDGLHRRAGSRRVLELHGALGRARCSREGRVVTSWEEGGPVPPRCPDCGAPLRPDVVWFGEPLPDAAWDAAVEAIGRCEVLLSVGTSGQVYPAASLVPLALEAGAAVIVVNPDPAARPDPRCIGLAGLAGDVLPRLVAASASPPRG